MIQEDNIRNERVKNMLPEDPMMLLSVLNMKLRDFYDSLDALCEDLDVDKGEIMAKLEAEGYHYHKEKNRFA